MKIKLLVFICSLLYSSIGFSQYTPGNLLVYRYGDGSTTLTGDLVPVFLDQYKPDGTSVGTPLALPTVTSGSNYRLTGRPKADATATVYQTECFSSLSQDGKFLTVLGYDLAAGATSTSGVRKVVGRVDADGNVNTTTTLESAFNVPRTALAFGVNGDSFYCGASGTGVRYQALGVTNASASTTTSTQAATNPNSSRSFIMYNNVLYAAIGSNIIHVFSGLPTNTGNTSTQITLPTGVQANQIALFDINGDQTPDLMYVADDGGLSGNTAELGALRKFVLNGTTWEARGSVTVAGVTDGLKSITGTASNGTITLYGTTFGNLYSTVKVASQLLKFTDANAATSTIDATNNAPVVLKTASANTMFRSVTFTPGTTPLTVLPVKISSFSGKRVNEGVQLTWNTASEVQNSHFEVLRSDNGKDFYVIGKVTGSGTSSGRAYSYTDKTAGSGTNYYQLNQVDFNGKSEKSNFIAVNTGLNPSSFYVFSKEDGQISVSIYSETDGPADIRISDLSGGVLINQKVQLAKGNNSISLLSGTLNNGIYVATLTIKSKSVHIKFIK